MLPMDRHRLRTGHPPQAIPLHRDEQDEAPWTDEPVSCVVRSSRQDLDPVFGYILAMAFSVGLTPVQANTRFVLLWAFLAVMGGMASSAGSGFVSKERTPVIWRGA